MENDKNKLFEKQKKYDSYLKALTFVFLITILIVVSLLIYYYMVNGNNTVILNSKYQVICCAVSVFVFLIGALVSLFFSSINYSVNDEDIQDKIHSRSLAVTFLFFFHMLSVAIFVALDGGASASCMSNILLLDAVFGCFFAQKPSMKLYATLSCLASYVLVLFLYNEKQYIMIPQGSFESFFWKLPYLLTAFFVIGTYFVIFYFQNKSDKTVGLTTSTTTSIWGEISGNSNSSVGNVNTNNFYNSQVHVSPGAVLGSSDNGVVSATNYGSVEFVQSFSKEIKLALNEIDKSAELSDSQKSEIKTILESAEAAVEKGSDEEIRKAKEKFNKYKELLKKQAPLLLSVLANLSQIAMFFGLQVGS